MRWRGSAARVFANLLPAGHTLRAALPSPPWCLAFLLPDCCLVVLGPQAVGSTACHRTVLNGLVFPAPECLNPAHPAPLNMHPPCARRYVPWVLVNGIPLGGLDSQLTRIVCIAFPGIKPRACYEPPPEAAAVGRKPATPAAALAWA